jgi:putative phosphoesterase
MESSKESESPAKDMVVGVISDTHGLLRPEVVPAFKNVDLILHAGDIGDPAVLKNLQALAPVFAVRGNNDKEKWAKVIPEARIVPVSDIRVFMIHDVKEMETTPADCHVVVAGHSHRPLIEKREGILFLNPGSAGPRRFKLPICVARLTVRGSAVSAKLIEL